MYQINLINKGAVEIPPPGFLKAEPRGDHDGSRGALLCL